MKIAVFHELHRGGARKAVNEIAHHLKKKHTIDLYIVDGKKDSKEEKYFSSINFYKFIAKKWNGGNWRIRLYKDTIELLRLYFHHKRIAKEINRRGYDVIFIHPSQFTQAPFLLRFLHGRKVYYCQEPLRIAYDPYYFAIYSHSFKKIYEKLIRWLKKTIDRMNIKKADIILANSLFSKKSIKKAYNLPSHVCYLGVDTHFYKPSRNFRNIDLLFIGTQASSEGGELVQDISRRLNDKYTIKILDNTQEWVSDDDLRLLYQRAKIALCLARNEPFGLIPLEAGASGCVTIGLDEGGYKESIQDGVSGFLLKPDGAVIAKKIKRLLADPDELHRISHNARQLMVEEWSWQKAANNLEKIFKALG